MNLSLFDGERIRLAAPDPDRDSEVEAQWTHDPKTARLLDAAPARPLSPGGVKKQHERAAKEPDHGRFAFAIRTHADDRLIGFVRLKRISWTHGGGLLSLGIGAPADRRQGYGSEALRLALRYAFHELNLHRLSAVTFEYNTGGLRFLERAGFRLEVRRRQAAHRGGKRWDVLMLGLLREEWEALQAGEASRGRVGDG